MTAFGKANLTVHVNGDCKPTARRTGHLHVVGGSNQIANARPSRSFASSANSTGPIRADADRWDQLHREGD